MFQTKKTTDIFLGDKVKHIKSGDLYSIKLLNKKEGRIECYNTMAQRKWVGTIEDFRNLFEIVDPDTIV